MMRRILIVDDEKPVASGIEHILKRDFSKEYEAVGIASSGRQAVEKTSALNPDIVLMDVRMPGFSGLEAIKELRKRGSRAAFVMVTAYERFEIAREAMELGVVDYLLKPVSSEALSASLAAASKYLDDKEVLERLKLELHEKDELLKSISEKAFFRAIISGPASGDEMARYWETLGMRGETVLACVFGIGGRSGSAQGRGGESPSSARIKKAVASIRYKTSFLSEVYGGSLGCVIAPIRREQKPEEIHDAVVAAVAEDCAAGGPTPTLIFGFGEPRTPEDAHLSLNEAVLDYFAKLSKPAHNSPVAGVGPPAENERLGLLYALRQNLLRNRIFQARLSAKQYIQRLREGSSEPEQEFDASPQLYSPDSLEIFLLFAIVGEQFVRSRDSGEPETMLDDAIRSMRPLFEAASLQEFAAAAGAWLGLALEYAEKNAEKYSRAVAAAIAFVEENYSKAIDLESAAAEVGISPNRLSRLFVEETGNGFSRYLVSYRIDRAKEMLSRKGATVKEISVACGYPDQNYFARLFKKVTGVSPSAYNSGIPEASDEK